MFHACTLQPQHITHHHNTKYIIHITVMECRHIWPLSFAAQRPLLSALSRVSEPWAISSVFIRYICISGSTAIFIYALYSGGVNHAAVCVNTDDLSLSAASLGIWSFRTIFTICIGSKTTQRDASWVKNGCSAKLDKLWGVGVRGLQMHRLLPLIWKAWRLIICTNRHTGKGPTKQSLCQIIH